MSATGRSKRGGEGVDNFPTPAFCVHRFLEAWDVPVAHGLWLEPGAGDGAIVRAVQSFYMGEMQPKWVVTEIREEMRGPLSTLPNLAAPPIIGDFTKDDGTERIFDVAFGNPPYRSALEFIRVALRRARHVAFLLRLNFLESEGRHGFLKDNVPDVFVLPQRPSFDGKGTDATAYCWAHWRSEEPKSHGTVRILGLTPESERSRRKAKEKPKGKTEPPVDAGPSMALEDVMHMEGYDVESEEP